MPRLELEASHSELERSEAAQESVRLAEQARDAFLARQQLRKSRSEGPTEALM